VVPYVWSIDISQATAGAVFASISHQDPLRITHLCRDPRSRERRLACIPLMLLRGEEYFLMPDEDLTLQSEDSLLFCGGYGIASRMEWVLQNANALNYVVTGDENPAGYVWQWFNRRWGNTSRQ
ncbi:MAG: potassium transporter TrkA, partial [Gammaproteobacteria bacterium]|nr:potassium transporter TrkA [Gammaproteobacteria bacterium]